MKQINPFYTAGEVVEILQRAKELGVVTMKLQGFEAAFEVQGTTRPAVSSRILNSIPNKKDNVCDCGHIKVQGRFGLYCHPCWVAERENA